MSLQAEYFKKTFHFNFKARTSRGLMKDKTSWFVRLWHKEDPSVVGIGECGPLPQLSVDAVPDFEDVLKATLSKITALEKIDLPALISTVSVEYPSIIFALETAWLDLSNGGKRIIYNNDFINGKTIPINGLIWMGDLDFMMNQINEKIVQGFRCIKLKVGGLNFDRECEILDYIRKRYFRENITIRLDANGAFKIDDVLYRLEELSKYGIHSIEQPIKPNLPEMEELCRKSPIPVALDEELIGKYRTEQKIHLLQSLKPPFIILKPTLHGGLQGCAEWIELARINGAGWWITSALESNIGLNAICQFTANFEISIPQGLGTGAIYTDNVESPLAVKNGTISSRQDAYWDDTFLS